MSRNRQQQAMGPEDDMEAARQFAPLDSSKNKDYGPPYVNEYNWDPKNRGPKKCYYQTGDEADRCYVTTKGGPGGQTKPKTGPSGDRKKYNKKYRKQRLKKRKRAMLRRDLIKLAYDNPGEIRDKVLTVLSAEDGEEAKGKSKGAPAKMKEFMADKGDEKVRNPDTGNQVKVKSLPWKHQKSVYEKWLKGQKGKDDDKGGKGKAPKKDDDKGGEGKAPKKDDDGGGTETKTRKELNDEAIQLGYEIAGELGVKDPETKTFGQIPVEIHEKINKDPRMKKHLERMNKLGSTRTSAAFDDLVKIAMDNPGIVRDKLLPILAKEAKGKIPPQFLKHIKKKDDDKDDDKGSKDEKKDDKKDDDKDSGKPWENGKKGSVPPSFDDLVKLAHDNPGDIRNYLLPLLTKAAKGKIPPQFLEHIKKKDDDKGDDDKGSKDEKKDEKKDDKKDDDKDSGKPWEKDKKGSVPPSFDDLVKLAHDNPGDIRNYLLPLLAKAAKGKIPPQFLEHIKKKDDDKGDDKDDKKDDDKD